MEFESTRMCELLVGLPDVNVLDVVDVAGEPLRVHVETREPRPWCPGCGGEVAVKDRPAVELVDLAVFGRRAGSSGASTGGAARACRARSAPGPVSIRRSPRPGSG